MEHPFKTSERSARARIERFRRELGPFVVAAQTTRMAMIFTDGQDPRNPIVFANDAFLRLTGFSREAILDEPLSLLLGNVTDSGTLSSIRTAMIAGDSGTWEMQCRRADQSEFLAAIFLSPVHDKNEVVRQYFLSFVELGGHVDRLLDQRNEFHSLYERAPGFIATVESPQHRFTFANASYRRFVSRDNLDGLLVSEALPEMVDQGFIALLDLVYRTGEPFIGRSMPIAVVDPATGTSRTRYADFVYQAVRNANNVITGLFCAGYDVTAQRETAETLSALQSEVIYISRVNAMGTMATTLAHELNQPLSAIANYAAGSLRLLDPAARDAARLVQALQGIQEASQRAAEIIRNLRELTRRREPARATFNLKTAVGECVRMVRATAPSGIEIVDQTVDNIGVSADRVQIQQVIINLLRNACDAVLTSNRLQVSISAKTIDEQLVVGVADTGLGVSLEVAESIFSWSDTTKEGGMGLGLSICRTIIEAHQGRIWLENSGRYGSEFCFSLPLEPSPSSADDLPADFP